MEFELGFRFRPSDSERLAFLLRFITKHDLRDRGFISTNVDVYGKEEPWEIYHRGIPCGGGDGEAEDCSSYRFFITKLKTKNNGKRFKREVGKGTWKQDNTKLVHNEKSVVIGSKKSMSYVNKKLDTEALGGKWLMKEYEFSKVILKQFPEDCKDYVLCAIRKKPSTSSSTTTTMLNSSASSVRDQETEVTNTTSVDNSWAMGSSSEQYSQSKTMTLLNFQESHDAMGSMVLTDSSTVVEETSYFGQHSGYDIQPAATVHVESETVQTMFQNDFNEMPNYQWDDFDVREFINGI